MGHPGLFLTTDYNVWLLDPHRLPQERRIRLTSCYNNDSSNNDDDDNNNINNSKRIT